MMNLIIQMTRQNQGSNLDEEESVKILIGEANQTHFQTKELQKKQNEND